MLGVAIDKELAISRGLSHYAESIHRLASQVLAKLEGDSEPPVEIPVPNLEELIKIPELWVEKEDYVGKVFVGVAKHVESALRNFPMVSAVPGIDITTIVKDLCSYWGALKEQFDFQSSLFFAKHRNRFDKMNDHVKGLQEASKKALENGLVIEKLLELCAYTLRFEEVSKVLDKMSSETAQDKKKKWAKEGLMLYTTVTLYWLDGRLPHGFILSTGRIELTTQPVGGAGGGGVGAVVLPFSGAAGAGSAGPAAEPGGGGAP